MSKEIEAAVAAILERDKIKYTVKGRGETKRDDWVCDEWVCTFTSERAPGEDFEYYTGTGHRKRTEFKERLWKISMSVNPPNPRSLMYQSMMKANPPMPVPPSPASVLWSILLDSDAECQPFSEWASDLGYNPDSIKDRETWEACIRNARKLRHIFNREQIEELRTTLEDY